LIARKEFVDHVHNVRTTQGHLMLPSTFDTFNCRQLIDQELSREALLQEASKSSEGVAVIVESHTENDMKDRSAVFNSHSLEGPSGSPEPDKKKTKRRI
jgi:hypothetical protein